MNTPVFWKLTMLGPGLWELRGAMHAARFQCDPPKTPQQQKIFRSALYQARAKLLAMERRQ